MRNAVSALFSQKLPRPVQEALQRMLLLDQVGEVYNRVDQIQDGRSFPDKLLSYLEVHPRVSDEDMARIPRKGAVIVVANHPFGMIEGPILTSLLPTIRPDFKIMTNFLLSEFAELRNFCIFVDPFGGKDSIRSNHKGLKESLQLLRNGGMLVIFPAGEVAHFDFKQRRIVDPPWNPAVARLARITGAAVLPMYFDGVNSALFHLLGMIHPRMRTAMLPHEFLNKRHMGIELRIGNPIPAKKLQLFGDDQALLRYLRQRTCLLEGRRNTAVRKPLSFPLTRAPKVSPEPVAPPMDGAVLQREIEALSAGHFVAEAGECVAVLAQAHEIPNCLREIGRLREVTFRQAGEGTGKALDLDGFDQHYLHLFAWSKATREIVGAYRLGPSDDIVARFGKKGLYTSTLFAYKPAFLDRIAPAVELGRSFVRMEYQKSYAPLVLLWKGIGQFVAKNPRYKVLFGPVSISNDYRAASRQLMVTFLNSANRSDLSRLVKPRSPFRARLPKDLSDLSGTAEWDVEELSSLVAEIEADHKGVPILLKQYLKLGGKLVSFNVDPHFGNTLDGLIVVDLSETAPRLLERYLGKENAAAFSVHHGAGHHTRMPA